MTARISPEDDDEVDDGDAGDLGAAMIAGASRCVALENADLPFRRGAPAWRVLGQREGLRPLG